MLAAVIFPHPSLLKRLTHRLTWASPSRGRHGRRLMNQTTGSRTWRRWRSWLRGRRRREKRERHNHVGSGRTSRELVVGIGACGGCSSCLSSSKLLNGLSQLVRVIPTANADELGSHSTEQGTRSCFSWRDSCEGQSQLLLLSRWQKRIVKLGI